MNESWVALNRADFAVASRPNCPVLGRAWLVLVALLASTTTVACMDGDESPSAQFCAVPVDPSPIRGNLDAPVTIVEFADFQCPYCGRVQPTLQAIDRERPDQIRWVFKHFPLTMHAHAFDAAIATACAHRQGAFWEMADEVFANQAQLSATLYAQIAASLDLDLEVWQSCYDAQATADEVNADYELGIKANVAGTPAFYINGQALFGARPLGDFLELIDEEIAKEASGDQSGAEYYEGLVQMDCR